MTKQPMMPQMRLVTARPLPRLAPGDPAEQLQSFELQLVDRLWEMATPENAREVADRTWDLAGLPPQRPGASRCPRRR